MKKKMLISMVSVLLLLSVGLNAQGSTTAPNRSGFTYTNKGLAPAGSTATSPSTPNYTLDTAPLYTFNSYLGSSDGLQQAINSIVQGVFYIAKCIYWFANKINAVLNYDVVGNFAQPIMSASSKYFQALFTGDVLGLIAIGIVILLITAMIKGVFFKVLARIVLLIFVNALFFAYAGTLITQVSNGINSVQKQLTTSITISGVPNSNVDMRQLMLIQPFELMNFDSSSQYGKNNSNVNKLLDTEYDANAVLNIETSIHTDNHLKFSAIGDKFSVAFGSIFNNLFLAVVIVGLSLVAFTFKVMFLILLLFAPIAAVASFFPQLENAMFNLIKKAFAFFIIGSVMGFATTFILLFNNLLDFIFVKMGLTSYFADVFLKIGIFCLIWKFRQEILGVFHNAASSMLSNPALSGISNAFSSVRDRSFAPVAAGIGTLGGAMGMAAFDVSRNKLGSKLLDHRLGRYSQALGDKFNPGASSEQRNKAGRKASALKRALDKRQQVINGGGVRNRLATLRDQYGKSNPKERERLQKRQERMANRYAAYEQFKKKNANQIKLQNAHLVRGGTNLKKTKDINPTKAQTKVFGQTSRAYQAPQFSNKEKWREKVMREKEQEVEVKWERRKKLQEFNRKKKVHEKMDKVLHFDRPVKRHPYDFSNFEHNPFL